MHHAEINSTNRMSTKRQFTRVATAGITFQAGSSAIDSATIMSALIFQLTGSTVLVGAVTAILRFGWLFPQLIVGYLAQRSGSSMHYYAIGAFGRASCMALLAITLVIGAQLPNARLAIAVMVLWTVYSFVSGIVAVPYNDIVARAVPSELRSRLLATRFFGGGVLALGVVAIADKLVSSFPFPQSYAVIISLASILMFVSSMVFTTVGESKAREDKENKSSFIQYLKEGINVFHDDRQFRLYVYAQWCGGAVLMAMPFYVVQASVSGFQLERVALLLGGQTLGALSSNLLWGWWGDKLGKGHLMRVIALGRVLPPIAIIALATSGSLDKDMTLFAYVAIFFVLGALANGLTISVIGFLMEISPDHLRPAYSGYFNAMTAPAFLLPLLAGILIAYTGLLAVFVISMIAGSLQFYFMLLVGRNEYKKQPHNNN